MSAFPGAFARATAMVVGLLVTAALLVAVTSVLLRSAGIVRSHVLTCAGVGATSGDVWAGAHCLVSPMIVVDRE